jgi:DNA-binding transcriptional MerR regulator
MNDEILVKDAAKILGVHPTTVHYYIRKGRLPAREASFQERKAIYGEGQRHKVLILSRAKVEAFKNESRSR